MSKDNGYVFKIPKEVENDARPILTWLNEVRGLNIKEDYCYRGGENKSYHRFEIFNEYEAFEFLKRWGAV